MRTKTVLTIADARKMVEAAKVEAEKNKWPVTIAVVDEAGLLLMLERMHEIHPVRKRAPLFGFGVEQCRHHRGRAAQMGDLVVGDCGINVFRAHPAQAHMSGFFSACSI